MSLRLGGLHEKHAVATWNLFKYSVRTSKRTPHFTITKIRWLTLFKEIIAVYSEKYAEPINTKYSVTDCYDSWDI
jgi:hypothetical protein